MGVTRWNSQYLMLSRFIEALDKDKDLQSKLKAFEVHGKLLAMEIKMIRELIFALEPFRWATDVFQGDYETVGWVIPMYIHLLNFFSFDRKVNATVDRIVYTKAACSVFYKSLEKRLQYVLTQSATKREKYVVKTSRLRVLDVFATSFPGVLLVLFSSFWPLCLS